ncbi:hypothetical protein GGR57DRAFT_507825 [Xylariaceae sp. FL1272]|nr:hypothetical protein GGR57DRAFT_507825 [Xylariaceae sp. FL1272]
MASKASPGGKLLHGTDFELDCGFSACREDRVPTDPYSTKEYTVYSTEELGTLPTHLHLHTTEGCCIDDSFRTSQMIIEYRSHGSKDHHYFYVTASRRPASLNDGTVRRGCVAVGVIPSYDRLDLSQHQYNLGYEDLDDAETVKPELVHIHRPQGEASEALFGNMTEKFDKDAEGKGYVKFSALRDKHTGESDDPQLPLEHRVRTPGDNGLMILLYRKPTPTQHYFRANVLSPDELDRKKLYISAHNLGRKGNLNIGRSDAGCFLRKFGGDNEIGLLTHVLDFEGAEGNGGSEKQLGCVQPMAHVMRALHYQLHYIVGSHKKT